MEENYLYKEAKKRVNRKKGFYRHLAVYIAVNTVFFFVVFIKSGTLNWIYPASFWGIGLVINYFSVFGLPGSERVGGTDWETKEIRKEMEKMGGHIDDLPDEKFELREIQKQPKDWNDSDLV